MNLFELFAKLVLDTSEFETGASAAIDKSSEIEEAIKKINTDSIDQEIAALDAEIAALDDEIHKLEMANLDDDIAAAEAEIEKLSSQLDGLDEKSAISKGIIEGLRDVGVDLAKEAIQFMFDFASASLDIAAESGTEAGNILKQAREDFSLSTDIIQNKLGQFLAPAAAALTDFGEALLGVTKEEKLTTLFQQLDGYTFDNLQNVKSSLEGIFGMFDRYEPAEDVDSLYDMASALDSQIAYWEEYNRVVNSLRERGFDDSMLASLADGQADSLQTLQTFADASDEELQAMSKRYAQLETARNEAAAAISAAQLDVDASVTEIIDTIARIGSEVDSGQAAGAALDVTQGIIDALASQYPSIESWVDTINAKIASLMSPGQGSGVHFTPGGTEGGGASGQGFATGLDYVPYNNFPARLHEGEAVLTKSEANAWRRGEVNGVVPDFTGLAEAIAEIINDRPIAINIDGKTFATLMAREMSRSIGNRNIQTLMGMGG